MDNKTLFYVCGIVLASSALVVSFAGLRLRGFPGRALPLVIVWFAVFVLGAPTFAVRYGAEGPEKEEPVGPTEGSQEEAGGKQSSKGAEASTTLDLAADSTALAFDET